MTFAKIVVDNPLYTIEGLLDSSSKKAARYLIIKIRTQGDPPNSANGFGRLLTSIAAARFAYRILDNPVRL